MPTGGKSYSRPPAGAGGTRKKTTPTSRVEKPTAGKGASYTSSPAVKAAKPGYRGGVWRDKQNRVVGTSKSEDSPMKPVRKRGQAPSRKS